MKRRNKLKCMVKIVLVLAGTATESQAQLNPFAAMYQQNPYIANPAMAGINQGLDIALGYRQQMSSIPGTPKTQSVTASYNPGKNLGLGLNLMNDHAGLQKMTRGMGTVAYHLPLDGESGSFDFDDRGRHLSFGLSVGLMDERLETESIDGDEGDLAVGLFNQRETYIDGDFGMAYSDGKLTLQGAVPNLKQFLKKDNSDIYIDRSTFLLAASYRLALGAVDEYALVEPTMLYRGVKGYKNVIDAGTTVNFLNNTLNLLGFYHTSGSFTVGLGVNYRSRVSVMGVYTTTTSALRSYTGGDFELGLKVKAF